MKNITVPTRTVSFEDALRNLASRLTGKPAPVLPRTQEGVVQYLADTLPSVDALAEAITKEVLARMAAVEPPTSANGSSGGTDIPGARRNRHGGRHGRHGAPQGPQA